MTLAPQSASCRTQVGPARTRVRSSTVKRDRACEACGMDISRLRDAWCVLGLPSKRISGRNSILDRSQLGRPGNKEVRLGSGFNINCYAPATEHDPVFDEGFGIRGKYLQ